jgi:predicted alpha/beta superfamily hydrolase
MCYTNYGHNSRLMECFRLLFWRNRIRNGGKMNAKQLLMSLFWPAAFLLAGLLMSAPAISQEQQVHDLTIGKRFTVYSEVLAEDRTLLVALPRDYHDSEERFPVLYVLDGEFFFYQAQAAVQFLSECTYIRTHPIPQMIVVGIVNVDRNRDFTPTNAPVQGELRYPTSGGAKKFLKFLQAELVPKIDVRYRTQPYRVLSGWSFGGLFTVYTYLENPRVFSAYLAISPSLWWEQDGIIKKAKDAIADENMDFKPLVVTLGALEGGDMDRSVRRGLFPLFKSKQVTAGAFTPIEIVERGHYYSPYQAFFDGLQALFEKWALPQERLEGGLESIKDFYQGLSAKAGYTIKIPESAYQALVGSLISEDNDQAALEIARLTVEKYPKSSRAHKTLGVMLMRTGNNDGARAQFERAIEVEKQLTEPDSERIMDAWLMLWLLDQGAGATDSDSN